MVVIKVASSQVGNSSGYWPPALPDSIETIAASYVQDSANSKVRLFNLSPDTKQAGMTCSVSRAASQLVRANSHRRIRVQANGTKEIASAVDYSLGSEWVTVPTASATYAFKDDSAGTALTGATKTETAPAAPIGFTNMLIGLQKGSGPYEVQVVPLDDAPEGGTCHP